MSKEKEECIAHIGLKCLCSRCSSLTQEEWRLINATRLEIEKIK